MAISGTPAAVSTTYRPGFQWKPEPVPQLFAGSSRLVFAGSAQSEDVRGNSIYLFAQDSWKIRRNLTLNYGLRWEYNQPLYDAGLRYQTFRPGQATTTYPCQLSVASGLSLGYITDPNTNPSNPALNCNPGGNAEAVFPLGLVVPGDKGVPKGLTESYYKSFAPRIGIAWDPWERARPRYAPAGDSSTTRSSSWCLSSFRLSPPSAVARSCPRACLAPHFFFKMELWLPIPLTEFSVRHTEPDRLVRLPPHLAVWGT